MILVNVTYVLKPSAKADDYVQGLKDEGILEIIRGREGCVAYDYYTPMEENGTFFLVEKWADQNALDAHQASPYMDTLRRIKDMFVADTKVDKYSV